MARINRPESYPISPVTRETLLIGSATADTGVTQNYSGDGIITFIESELSLEGVAINYRYETSNPTNENGVFLFSTLPPVEGQPPSFALTFTNIDLDGTDNSALFSRLGVGASSVVLGLRRNNTDFSYYNVTAGAVASPTTYSFVISPIAGLSGMFTENGIYRLSVDIDTQSSSTGTQSDWDETDTGSDAFIQNKPTTITPAQTSKLAGIADNAEVNVQADWNEASSGSDAFIQNKPTTITSAQTSKLAGIADNAEVNVQADWNEASSGSDAFIQNKPTLAPSDAEANVQADWNETNTSSDAFIQNKPTIPTIPDGNVLTAPFEISAGQVLAGNPLDMTPQPIAGRFIQLHAISFSYTHNGTAFNTGNIDLRIGSGVFSNTIPLSTLTSTRLVNVAFNTLNVVFDENAAVSFRTTATPSSGNGVLKFFISYKVLDR